VYMCRWKKKWGENLKAGPNPVQLEDVETKGQRPFRSLKALATYFMSFTFHSPLHSLSFLLPHSDSNDSISGRFLGSTAVGGSIEVENDVDARVSTASNGVAIVLVLRCFRSGCGAGDEGVAIECDCLCDEGDILGRETDREVVR